MSAELETTCQVSGEIEVPQENNPDPKMAVEENKYPQNEDLSDKSPKHQTSTSFSTSPNQLPLLPLVEANIALNQKTSPNSSIIPPNTQDSNKEGISSTSGHCPEDNTTVNVDTAMKEEPDLPSSVTQQIILPISPILLQPSSLSVATLLSNSQTSPTTSKSPLLQQPEQPRQTMQTPKQTQFQPAHRNNNNNKSSNSKPNNNNSNLQGSTSAWNDQSDFQKFTTAIASQPYLLFNTPDMAIPGLEASKDNLYHVYTFIVPNQPYQTIQSNIKHPNIQFPKKSAASSNNSLNNNQSFMQNNTTTPATPQNNNNNLLSQMNTPTTIKSTSPFFNPPTTPSRISPAGFQKPGDFSLPKSQSKPNITNAAFGSSSNFETPKIPHFGLGNTEKTERKISMNVAQSLVDLIKQQSRPKDSEHHEGEEERRKKSESVPTFNNLSGFKSNPSSMISSGQQQQQQKLSQSSITNLLNLSLNPLAHFNHNNNNLYADNILSSQLHQQLGIIPEESQQTLELFSQNEDAQNQLAQQMIMKNEANYSNINNPNNDEECEEEDDDGDDDDKNNEEEEARLIREIKEMKWNNNNNGFKKDGSLQQFLSEGQDGDIFDFCEEKFLNGGKKSKKSLGSAGHKNKFDTKNLVKNFLNSFISFVHHPDEEAGIMDVLGFENPSQLNDFRTSLRNFFKGKKFNRVLLKEFIFEDIFRPLFLFFLENRALNWIEAGRMKDKASHLRALKNFIFVCQNHDQIKSWRFRYNFVQN